MIKYKLDKMKDITSNEIKLVLKILKNQKQNYNANNLSKELDMSAMGVLKIAKRLEKEGILNSKLIGKARFYSINAKNSYSRQYLLFILKREAEHSSPYIKRWISEVKKIKNSDFAVLFGSVLIKNEKANDIDVLFVTSQKNFSLLKKEIEKINNINDKKIHPVFQTKQDIIDNIKKEDKILLNALRGIVVFGEELFLEVMEK